MAQTIRVRIHKDLARLLEEEMKMYPYMQLSHAQASQMLAKKIRRAP